MRIRTVVHTFGALIVGHVLAKLLALASGAALGRSLGPSELGIYGTCLTGMSYLLVLSNWGQDATGIRLTAMDHSVGGSLRRRILRVRLIAGTVAVGIGLLASAHWHWPMPIVLPLLGSVLVYAARGDWLLLGLGRPNAVSISGVVREAVFLILVIGVVGRWKSVAAAALCFLVAEIVWSLATQLLIGKHVDRHATTAPRAGELFRQGWPLAVMGMMSLTYSKIDTPMLAAMVGASAAGLYYACYSLLFAATGFAAVFSKSALPEMARAEGQDIGSSRRGVRSIALWGAVAGGSIAVVVSGSATAALAAVYGSRFAEGAGVLGILVLSLPLNFASGILLNSLVATGNRRPLAIGSGTAAVVNVALNVMFIPRWGMIGAAWATVASEATLLAAGLVGMGAAARSGSLAAGIAWVGLLTAAVVMVLPSWVPLRGVPLSCLNVVAYVILLLPMLVVSRRMLSPREPEHA